MLGCVGNRKWRTASDGRIVLIGCSDHPAKPLKHNDYAVNTQVLVVTPADNGHTFLDD